MAGYNGYSKSNNACIAEREGRLPASRLAERLGCTAAAVRDLLLASEWHHTSGWYQRTDYYAAPVLLALAAGDRHAAVEAAEDLATAPPGDRRELWMLIREVLGEQQQLLARLRSHRKDRSAQRRWTGCTVRWLEWSGSRRHPHADECRAEGCVVVWKGGATVEVDDLNSRRFRKRIGTRGFEVDKVDGTPLLRDFNEPRDLDGR